MNLSDHLPRVPGGKTSILNLVDFPLIGEISDTERVKLGRGHIKDGVHA